MDPAVEDSANEAAEDLAQVEDSANEAAEDLAQVEDSANGEPREALAAEDLAPVDDSGDGMPVAAQAVEDFSHAVVVLPTKLSNANSNDIDHGRITSYTIAHFKGNGTEDADSWLERFFTFAYLSSQFDAARADSFASHLKGRARQWYNEQPKELKELENWKELQVEFLMKFSTSPSREKILERHISLRRREGKSVASSAEVVNKEESVLNSAKVTNKEASVPSSTVVVSREESVPSSAKVASKEAYVPSSTDIVSGEESVPSSADLVNKEESVPSFAEIVNKEASVPSSAEVVNKEGASQISPKVRIVAQAVEDLAPSSAGKGKEKEDVNLWLDRYLYLRDKAKKGYQGFKEFERKAAYEREDERFDVHKPISLFSASATEEFHVASSSNRSTDKPLSRFSVGDAEDSNAGSSSGSETEDSEGNETDEDIFHLLVKGVRFQDICQFLMKGVRFQFPTKFLSKMPYLEIAMSGRFTQLIDEKTGIVRLHGINPMLLRPILKFVRSNSYRWSYLFLHLSIKHNATDLFDTIDFMGISLQVRRPHSKEKPVQFCQDPLDTIVLCAYELYSGNRELHEHRERWDYIDMILQIITRPERFPLRIFTHFKQIFNRRVRPWMTDEEITLVDSTKCDDQGPWSSSGSD